MSQNFKSSRHNKPTPTIDTNLLRLSVNQQIECSKIRKRMLEAQANYLRAPSKILLDKLYEIQDEYDSEMDKCFGLKLEIAERANQESQRKVEFDSLSNATLLLEK